MRIPVIVLLFALSAAGCAPAFEARGEDSILDGEGRDPDEREANRSALEALRTRAESIPTDGSGTASEPERPAIGPEGLPVVSVGPAEAAGGPADGSIRRAEIEAFVAQGPHALLGVVELAPFRRGDEAVGYELRGFLPGSGFLLAGGFLPGDIVQRVNGRNVLMPDEFMAAWTEVATRDTLTVDFVREGEELTFEWPIRGAAAVE